MEICIQTQVSQSISEVWQGFDKSLFLKLSPPFIPFKLLRFDGCSKKDEVHIELSFLFSKQLWISEITDNVINSNEIFFVDEGRKLPFFLSKWHHKHLLESNASGTLITDKINFESHNWLFTVLFFPVLYLQFLYRKPIYKRIFTKNQVESEHI